MNTDVVTRVEYVAIELIKPAPFNPPDRATARSITDLKASIERVGIIYPLVVTKDFDLVDGHRRLACAVALGMKTVPVIIRPDNQLELFYEVNQPQKKLTRSDELWVYLSGGLVRGEGLANIRTLERMIGRDGLEILAEERVSPRGILQVTMMLLRYTSKGEPDPTTGDNTFANRAVMWLVYNRQTFAVRRAIAGRMSPKVIASCVENGEPLP